MFKSYFVGVGITKKDFVTAFILVFNALTWYLMVHTVLDSIIGSLNMTHSQTIITWIIHYAALIGFGIFGAILSNKIDMPRFLGFWMLLGGVASLLPALPYNITIAHVLIISFVFGVSFGLGMPSCFAYFADCTIIENRGRIAGVIFLIVNLSTPFFIILLATSSLTMNSIISTIWRTFGLIIFFLLKPRKKIASGMRKNVFFASIFHDRSLILYLIAWLMFCFIDRFEKLVLGVLLEPDFYAFLLIIGSIIASISAFIGGLLCDLIGRKRVVIYGFVALGLAYAIIGIFPMTALWYFYSIIDGIATGILWVVFVLVVWGDLSRSGAREKYYAIGSIPLFFSSIIPQLLTPYVASIPAYAAFSLASFFLFLAILPLLYAPETLPEKKIRLRQLTKYLEKAKKVKEKYTKKGR